MFIKMNALPDWVLAAELRSAERSTHHEVRSWLKLATLGAD